MRHYTDEQPDENGLMPRQRMFCLELIRCNSPVAAARAVGYKQPSRKGFQLLKSNEGIKKYVAKLRKEIVEKIIIDTRYVVQNAVDILEACMAKDEGGKINNKQLDASGALKALELLSKYTGGFDKNTQRNEHSGPGGGPIPMVTADVTPELKARVEKVLEYYGKMRKSRNERT